MKQRHCIGDTAGFAEGGDAGGQAGGKARSTEAYRLHPGPLFSKKKHSSKGLGLLMSAAFKSSKIPPLVTSHADRTILRSA